VRPGTTREQVGVVWLGLWPDRRPAMSRMTHWLYQPDARSWTAMTFSSSPQSVPQFGKLVGWTLLGSILVASGLAMAYVTLATPLVSGLVPTRSGGGGTSIGLGVWSFALIAGGGLLVAGTNHLAVIVALLRQGGNIGGPAARALGRVSGEIAVAGDVVPDEGHPIPELVIGPFGVAVIHALPSSGRVRRGPAGWEARTRDGWLPMDDPLDVAMRDAERVRRWVGLADLDFVVRVHAALVVDDRALARTPTCAVLTMQQIPAWITSLPRQRTLTAGRRERLLAMARRRAGDEEGRQRRKW
jgi:hypothetical protein